MIMMMVVMLMVMRMIREKSSVHNLAISHEGFMLKIEELN
jgi:hypothetical protein